MDYVPELGQSISGQPWKPGQVWRQTLAPGMWRAIIAVHPAGVEWTSGPLIQPKAPMPPQPAEQAFSLWQTWNDWVRNTGAVCNG